MANVARGAWGGGVTRFILLEVDPALDRSRRVGIWCAAKLIPGVVSITDLEAVSRETLDVILFKPPTATGEVVALAKQEALL